MDDLSAKVRVELADHMPAFGAYVAGSLTNGEAVVLLNLHMCLSAAKSCEADPIEVISQVVAHELMHSLQEVMGAVFTESDIHAAIAALPDGETFAEEDEEQHIQALTNSLFDARKELLRVRALLAAANIDPDGD